jgi:hypothetical protein
VAEINQRAAIEPKVFAHRAVHRSGYYRGSRAGLTKYHHKRAFSLVKPVIGEPPAIVGAERCVG